MRAPLTDREKRTIIINRTARTSVIYGMLESTDKARAEVCTLLKAGRATKIVDTEETLVYILKDLKQ